MAYNIFEGFQAKDGAPNPARLAAAREVLAAARPDILVLNEALWCRPYKGRHIDYAALLGFPHACSALYDAQWGNAILSRHPIARARTTEFPERGALEALIETPTGPLTVATYHPHPNRRPEVKAKDFVLIAETAAGAPLALCGDFNAIFPADPELADRARLEKGFARLMGGTEAGAASLRRFVDSGETVFSELGRRGFADLVPLNARGFTIPTKLVNAAQDTAMRIDHIWGCGVAARAGGVWRGAAAEAASDHYPVWADLLPLAA